MKKLFTLFFLFVTTNVWADNPEYNEYNYKLNYENNYTTYRHTNLDTWHVEYGHKFKYVDVTYRYADLNVTQEKRIKFTVPVWSYENFDIKARMEYRSFDNKEDHWRYRFIVGYKYNITPYAQAWIKLQPRWAFKNNQKRFDSRDQAGIKFSYMGVSVSPFWERYSEGDLNNRTLNVFGTYFEYDL